MTGRVVRACAVIGRALILACGWIVASCEGASPTAPTQPAVPPSPPALAVLAAVPPDGSVLPGGVAVTFSFRLGYQSSSDATRRPYSIIAHLRQYSGPTVVVDLPDFHFTLAEDAPLSGELESSLTAMISPSADRCLINWVIVGVHSDGRAFPVAGPTLSYSISPVVG